MRVLVVEDNPQVAETLTSLLTESGFSVDSCATGFEAEDLVSTEAYSVVVLDLMLPDRDGVELCRSLRRREISTPILMLTALGGTHQKVLGLEAGADDYLTKPFAQEELVARVRALLRRAKSVEATTLRYLDVEMDLLKRTVHRAGQSIPLTVREFTLLEYLMRTPDRALSRTGILDSVWDRNYEPTTNLVDVFISSLRKKIDRSFTPTLIHTIPGTGYLFGEVAVRGRMEGRRESSQSRAEA